MVDIYRYSYRRDTHYINNRKFPVDKSRIGKPHKKFEDGISLREVAVETQTQIIKKYRTLKYVDYQIFTNIKNETC